MSTTLQDYTDDSILDRCEAILKGVDEHLRNSGLLPLADLSIASKILETTERRKRIHILVTDTWDKQSIELTGDAAKPMPLLLMSKQEYYDALGPNPDEDDEDE